MKIIIIKKIGEVEYQFETNKEDDMVALVEAGFLAAMPTQCKLCNSENIHLSSNKAKGYMFAKMLCEDCNARAQVGQYKDGGFFWKAWEKYEAPAQAGEPAPTEEA